MKTIICIALLALFLGGAFAQEVQPELFPHPHPHPHPNHKPPQHRHVFPGWKRPSLPPLSDLPPLPPLPAGIDCKNEVGNYLINHPKGSLSSQCCSLLKNDLSPLVKNIYNQACSGGAAPAPSAFAQEVQLESFQHPHPHPHSLQHPHHKPPQHRHVFPGWKRSLPPLSDLPPVPPLPPLPAGIDCKNEVGNYLVNHPQGSLSSQCCSLLKNDPSPLVKNIYNQACSGGAAPAPSAFAQEVQLESFQHPHPHPHHKPPQHHHVFPGWKRSLPPLSDLPPVPPLPAGIDCKNEVENYLINHPQGSLSSQCCSLLKKDPSPLIKTIYNQACSGSAAPAPSA